MSLRKRATDLHWAKVPTAMLFDERVQNRDVVIWAKLYAVSDGLAVSHSVSALCELCEVAPRTFRDSRARLEEAGWIKRNGHSMALEGVEGSPPPRAATSAHPMQSSPQSSPGRFPDPSRRNHFTPEDFGGFMPEWTRTVTRKQAEQRGWTFAPDWVFPDDPR